MAVVMPTANRIVVGARRGRRAGVAKDVCPRQDDPWIHQARRVHGLLQVPQQAELLARPHEPEVSRLGDSNPMFGADGSTELGGQSQDPLLNGPRRVLCA